MAITGLYKFLKRRDAEREKRKKRKKMERGSLERWTSLSDNMGET